MDATLAMWSVPWMNEVSHFVLCVRTIGMTEFQLERWASIRGGLDEFSLEDIYTLRKAIALKQIDTYWELGFVHIGHLQLLTREFAYDSILKKIYETMLVRVNDRVMLRQSCGEDLDNMDYEYMFKGQPFVYNEEVSEAHPHSILYDVKNCFYKRKLIKKYPGKYNLIIDMINV